MKEILKIILLVFGIIILAYFSFKLGVYRWNSFDLNKVFATEIQFLKDVF